MTDIREQVRDTYAQAARTFAGGLAGRAANRMLRERRGPGKRRARLDAVAAMPPPPTRPRARAVGPRPRVSALNSTGQTDRGSIPESAVLASLGCGNPTAVADLRPGETVLDLGSGAGIDVLLSAQRVGPTGRAYGLDMTDEMLALALANKTKAGATNVQFLKGYIEAIPLPSEHVDVVILIALSTWLPTNPKCSARPSEC